MKGDRFRVVLSRRVVEEIKGLGTYDTTVTQSDWFANLGSAQRAWEAQTRRLPFLGAYAQTDLVDTENGATVLASQWNNPGNA